MKTSGIVFHGRLFALLSLGILFPLSASAQTLQLPTFSYMTVNTTVSVPDQGSVFLGGIDRASSSRNETGVPGLPFRPFRNVGIGQDMSSSGMSVTATIHDMDAMDQAILGGGGGVAGSYGDGRSDFAVAGAGFHVGPAVDVNAPKALPAIAADRQPTRLEQHWDPQPAANVPHLDLAAAQERADRRTTRLAEAQDNFERGQAAEADGKRTVAKLYYQMAARRADGDLKQQVLVRLEAVSNTTTSLAGAAR